MRIAIIGTGISGLVAAHKLYKDHQITVFEKSHYIGGHTNTIDVQIGEKHWPVDTGFIVFNDRTYPNFVALLDELGVPSRETSMSFSVRCDATGLEYNGTSLDTLFAQRRNLLRPQFLGMVRDILRFNKAATAFALDANADPNLSLGDFLDRGRYGTMLVNHYVLPMGAAIWSATRKHMLDFPMRFFAAFFHNHGMLTVDERPQWRTVMAGSRSYVTELVKPWRDRIRLNAPVQSVVRDAQGVWLRLSSGEVECFDQVIMAVHSDQALSMIHHPSQAEVDVLGAIGYQTNHAILHTDDSVLPRLKKCHAAWNYHLNGSPQTPVSVTYHMNILQGLVAPENFLVTLNDDSGIDPNKVIRRIRYEHPIFSSAAVAAQERFHEINGVNGIHFCGAYWFYGFHEDGVRSGLRAAESVRALAGMQRKVVA